MSVNGANNNLRLGNSGQVKLTSFKGGIKREDLKNDKMKAIFDKVDNGDGVLTDAEIAKFKADLQEAAKDDKLSKREAKDYLKSGDKPVNTKEISSKDMMAFLQEIETMSEASKVEKAEEVTTEDGKTNVVLTSDGGNTVETIHTDDKTSTLYKNDTENNIETTENFDANHNITSSEVVDSSDAENVKTTVTEYNTAEAGETPTEKTITVKSNGYESVTECDENGNPTVKTETNEQDKTKTTTEFQPAEEGKEPVAKKVSVEGEGYNSETTFNDAGQPQAKHEVKGTVTSDYSYVDGSERLDKKVEDKGNGITAESTYEYTDNNNYKETRVEAGKTTVTTFEDGKKSTIQDENSFTQITYDEGGRTEITTETNGNVTVNELNTDGNRTQQTKVIDGKERTISYDGNGNTTGIVVQNGESPETIARKFGCSVADLKELNKDVLGDKKYFDVGAEITVPGEIEADSPVLNGRKSSEEAKAEFAADQERAEIARAQKQAAIAAKEAEYKAMGLKNHNGEGKPIVGSYNNGKQENFTIIGESGNGRHLAKSKDGKIVTISHDGKVLKNEYVQLSNIYTSGKKIPGEIKVKGKDGKLTTVTRSYVKLADMPKGRSVVIDSKGRQYVMSQDGKILDTNYLQRDAQADVISKDKNAAKTATLDILDNQIDSAVDAFNQQMAQDGWAGDLADSISWQWNNPLFGGGTGNSAYQVRADIKKYKSDLTELKSYKNNPAKFNAKFQQMYGVPYNETAVANYVRNPSEANYQKAFGTKNDIGMRVAKYNESQQLGATLVKEGAKFAGVSSIQIATRGAGGNIALAAETAAVSATVEETDRFSLTGHYIDADGNIVKQGVGFRKGTDHGEILKGAAEDGGMALIGGQIGTVAGKLAKGVSIGSKVARGTIKFTGSVGVGAAREYADTGQVTTEGLITNTVTTGIGAVGPGIYSKAYSKGKSVLTGNKPKVTTKVPTASAAKPQTPPKVTTNPAQKPKATTEAAPNSNTNNTLNTQTYEPEAITRIRRNPNFDSDEVTTVNLTQKPFNRSSSKTRLANDGSNFDDVMKGMDNVSNMSELNEYVSMTQHRGLNQTQRTQLQNAIREKKKMLMSNSEAQNVQNNNSNITNTNGLYKKNTNFAASYEVSPNAKLNLGGDYKLDLKSPEVKAKIDGMKDGDKLIVGRGNDADIKVPSSETYVSREHMIIEKRDGKIIVTDLSTNGSQVKNSMGHVGKVLGGQVAQTEMKKMAENTIEEEFDDIDNKKDHQV